MTNSLTVTTVADLSPNFWLSAFCETCLHWGDLDRERLPPDTNLDHLRRRLRCSKCGNREVLLYRGWDAGGFEVGYR